MNFTVQLDNSTLFKLARRASMRAKKLREKVIRRTTAGKQFAVWGLPYGEIDAAKDFIVGLKNAFPPEVMPETLLFVNNGKNGAYQSYIACGFTEAVFPHVQPLLNSIVGVTRDFTLQPEMLIAMAVAGVFEMETRLTPAKVDRAYGGRPQEPQPAS